MTNIYQNLRRLYTPAAYQGIGKTRHYFEGWYYKVVDQAGKNRFSFIPGISMTGDNATAHSFIQVFDGGKSRSEYLRYPTGDFTPSLQKTRVGRSLFSQEGIEIDLENDNIRISGELVFSNIISWPVKLLSPGAMGWYAFVPFLECYHGILSFNNTVDGYLVVDGKKIDFAGGRGYIEKDWGSSMPSAWIWMQSNHFDQPGIALSVSVARVPWFKFSFLGFVVGFLYKGELFRFTTYTRARISRLSVENGVARITVEDKHHRLEIEGIDAAGAVLASPIHGEMKGRIKESLDSEIKVAFFAKKGDAEQLVYSGIGRMAGMEIVGSLG